MTSKATPQQRREINGLRFRLTSCGESAHRQIGLRALRDAFALAHVPEAYAAKIQTARFELPYAEQTRRYRAPAPTAPRPALLLR